MASKFNFGKRLRVRGSWGNAEAGAKPKIAIAPTWQVMETICPWWFEALVYTHRWRIVETRGGAFPLVAVQFKAKWLITAVLYRYKPNMNVKTTIILLDVCLKRHFIQFFFHFEGVLLAVRGCTSWVENCQNARGCFSIGDCSVHSLATEFSCS